jgi:hypothetical protein
MNIRPTLSLVAGIMLAGITLATSTAVAACTQTGFFRDGIDMTAAVIAEGDITRQTIDATGCNIGIYYGPETSGTVDRTEVKGSNYFGIVASGEADAFNDAPGAVSVDVTNSSIHNIGETPFNGTQHGVAVYYNALTPGTSATGAISGSTVFAYQKGGIVVNGSGAAVSVRENSVRGNGPVPYIAQNGIQIGRGAGGQILRNTVTGHSYTGTNGASSSGILIFGGCGDPLTTGVHIVMNAVGSTKPADGNDIGVALANFDPTCSTAPTTDTNNTVINNTIINAELTNISGNGSTGYQAGIFDSGVNDKLINNDISGIGYANTCNVNGTPETCAIDTTSSQGAKVHANAFGP